MLTTFISNNPLLASIVITLLTIITYQFAAACQQKWQY
ncbi:MAG: hypothetical protein ACI952_002467, partial [Flavobacteriales bacterium]